MNRRAFLAHPFVAPMVAVFAKLNPAPKPDLLFPSYASILEIRDEFGRWTAIDEITSQFIAPIESIRFSATFLPSFPAELFKRRQMNVRIEEPGGRFTEGIVTGFHHRTDSETGEALIDVQMNVTNHGEAA